MSSLSSSGDKWSRLVDMVGIELDIICDVAGGGAGWVMGKSQTQFASHAFCDKLTEKQTSKELDGMKWDVWSNLKKQESKIVHHQQVHVYGLKNVWVINSTP